MFLKNLLESGEVEVKRKAVTQGDGLRTWGWIRLQESGCVQRRKEDQGQGPGLSKVKGARKD